MANIQDSDGSSQGDIPLDMAARWIALDMEGTSLRKMVDIDPSYPDLSYWKRLVQQTMVFLSCSHEGKETLSYGEFQAVRKDIQRINRKWLPPRDSLDISCDPSGTDLLDAEGYKIEEFLEKELPALLYIPDMDIESHAEDIASPPNWRIYGSFYDDREVKE